MATYEELQSMVERLETQLSLCLVATRRPMSGSTLVSEGDYGWSATYQGIVELRRLCDRQAEEIKQLKEQLAREERISVRELLAERRGGD